VVVEDLLATRAQEGKDVFEVRRGARCSAKGRRVKQAASRSQEEDAPEATADLEPTGVKVSVRNAVAGDVEKRTQNDRCEPRAAGGASRSACRNVEGDDHGHCLAESRSSPSAVRRHWVGEPQTATAGAGSRAKLSSPSRMMSISWTSMLLPVAGMLELPRYMSEAKGGSRRPSQSDSECGAQTLGPVGICEMPCSIWPESLSFTSRAMSACATIPTSLLSSSTTGILRTW